MSEPTTIESIRAALEPMGFHWQKAVILNHEAGCFYKRIETKRPCLCNDRDQLLIRVYAPSEHMPGWVFEVEMTGEFVQGLWANLKVYSIRGLSELLERLPRIQRSLVAAWEALDKGFE